MELSLVVVVNPEGKNVILGQSHFVKTVEDLHEALVTSVPGIEFGLAFCEASGDCLVRHSGTHDSLEALAVQNALAIGAGHSFVVILGNAYPINVLDALRRVPEVCTVFCATANPLSVVVAETPAGRGILGVIDGAAPRGVEDERGVSWRQNFLRKIGYKV
ncbi:MAG: adenosine-specific kinase [Candidatus Bipolaricaulota bacterium]